MNRRTSCWALLVTLMIAAPPPAARAEPPAAVEVSPETAKSARRLLEQSNDVHKAITSARYMVKVELQTTDGPVIAGYDGKVLVAGESATGADKFRVDGKCFAKTANAEYELSLATDGKHFSFIDHTNKSFRESDNSRGYGLAGDLATMGLVPEFCHVKPFGAELEGRVQLLGVEPLDGVDCYRIKVIYGRNDETAEFWIATRDLVLRRKMWETPGPQETRLRTTQTLTELDVNLKVDDGDFRLAKPDGYQSPQE